MKIVRVDLDTEELLKDKNGFCIEVSFSFFFLFFFWDVYFRDSRFFDLSKSSVV